MTFEATDGENRIFARIFEPAQKQEAKAILQIAHGMAEHSQRYEAFGRYLANDGFVVCVNDHAGHGRSVPEGGSFGYFGEGGYHNLTADMDKLRRLVQADYPNLPYVLMGHSMGSFLSRSYVTQYAAGIRAAIFCGTSAGLPGPAMKVGETLANVLVKRKGPKAYDKRLQALTTGGYNKKFEPARTENDWLTRDEAEVDKYNEDVLCGFPFTTSGYRELIRLLSDVNTADWYRAVPDIPILLIAGDKDPVGDFGKGVSKVAQKLTKTGHRVTLKLYPDCRHELLNELNKQEVYQDVHAFLEAVLSAQ